MSATSRVLTGLGLGALIGLVLAWSDPALACASPTSRNPSASSGSMRCR